MNTLLCCCGWTAFLDKLPCTLISITLIISVAVVLKTVLPICISNCHERKLAEKKKESEVALLNENDRFELQKQRLELEQRLAFEKKLWDKLLKEEKSEDVSLKFEELKTQFEKLKEEYPRLRLDVEIHNETK